MQVNIQQAKSLVLDILKAGLVPFLQSSPALGKSSIIKQIADDNNLKFIDIRLSQCDPIDLMGMVTVKDDKGVYLPMGMFPIAGDPIPEGKKGFLICFDELNAASLAIQAASYRIILDKEVGQHKLHPQVAIVAAGNLATDKAIVNRMSTAMQSRLIHLEIEIDQKSWIQWADLNRIDHRVKSFIQFKPQILHDFSPNHADYTYASPRTWEFVSKLIKPYPELSVEKLPLLAGAVGEGAAREFYAYTKVYEELPHIKDILRDPEHVSFGSEPSIAYALSGLIAHNMSEANATALIKFLIRLTIDFQVICLRSVLARNIELKSHSAIKEWIRVNSKELM